MTYERTKRIESNVHDDELNTVDDGKMDFKKTHTHTHAERERKKTIKTNSMKPNVCSFCIYRPSCSVQSVCTVHTVQSTYSVHVTYFVRGFNDS